MVNGEKMSKKLGNFFTVRDVLAKGYTGREIRYALLTVNYRLPLNFTLDGMAGVRAALQRIDEWVARLESHAGGAAGEPTKLTGYEEGFFAALDDDLNISGALGQMFDLIRESNSMLDRGELSPAQAAQVLSSWKRLDQVLALQREVAAVPGEVSTLVEQRQQARLAKNWAESDRLRDEIAKLGWTVKDTKDGPKLTPN